MGRHTTKQRLGILAMPLLALVVLCFLCALCYPGGAAPSAGFGGAGIYAEQAVASDASADQDHLHACPTPDEQGLLTAHPVLALGSALILCLPVVPRAGPSSRRPRRDPASPHGYRLLTLLCVQRV